MCIPRDIFFKDITDGEEENLVGGVFGGPPVEDEDFPMGNDNLDVGNEEFPVMNQSPLEVEGNEGFLGFFETLQDAAQWLVAVQSFLISRLVDPAETGDESGDEVLSVAEAEVASDDVEHFSDTSLKNFNSNGEVRGTLVTRRDSDDNDFDPAD